MARYWVYLHDTVVGPYELDHLIRLRGFSRQTLVCVEDSTGKPKNWISPADIPELAHIFKAVDDHLAAAPTPAAPPGKPSAKASAPRPVPKRAAPVAALRSPPQSPSHWVRIAVAAILLAAGAWFAFRFVSRGSLSREREVAQALVENAQLPATSIYKSVRHFLQEKGIQPRWDIEQVQDALYHVTMSWYGKEAATVYAFEVNIQAQTVRGLNTTASKLLSEGFPAPAFARSKSPSPPKKSPDDLFSGALEERRQAIESGDFQTVWSAFSQRKRTEMARGGMSHDGFIRLQNLTYHVDSAVKQTVLKSKKESDTQRLVLLKQSQTSHPDIFIKQLWVFDGDAWRLDDEEKRAAATQASEPAAAVPAASSAGTSSTSSPAPAKPIPKTLPGMSN